MEGSAPGLRPVIQYGARVVNDGAKRWAAWVSEYDLRRDLKLAFMQTKDFDAAFDMVHAALAKKVREATR